jgi:hypothetical protein
MSIEENKAISKVWWIVWIMQYNHYRLGKKFVNEQDIFETIMNFNCPPISIEQIKEILEIGDKDCSCLSTCSTEMMPSGYAIP